MADLPDDQQEDVLPPSPYAKPGPYVTTLSPEDEQAFQNWVTTKKIPFDPSPTADYDMRGYYKAMVAGDQYAKQKVSDFDGRPHFPDTYKTPYHKTFSNESQYATPDAPHWKGDQLLDNNGNIVADETPKKAQPKSAIGDWSEISKALGLTPDSSPDEHAQMLDAFHNTAKNYLQDWHTQQRSTLGVNF